MQYTFYPNIFIGQPMHLVRIADDDFRVVIAGHTAERIFKTMRGNSKYTWLWTITGPYLPGSRLCSSGECDTLQDTTTVFRSVFDAWLEWALLRNASITWHE